MKIVSDVGCIKNFEGVIGDSIKLLWQVYPLYNILFYYMTNLLYSFP